MDTLLSTPDQLALNLVWVLSVQNTSETADLPTQTSPVFIENCWKKRKYPAINSSQASSH